MLRKAKERYRKGIGGREGTGVKKGEGREGKDGQEGMKVTEREGKIAEGKSGGRDGC